MLGSLLYLIASRPHIMFSICMCARFQATPRESYFKIIKHILMFLRSTSNHGLWFPKGSGCSLVGYSDYDFARCKSDRKSTSGTCNIFGNCLISWNSKKQNNYCTHSSNHRITCINFFH